jgi:hypothetical protein
MLGDTHDGNDGFKFGWLDLLALCYKLTCSYTQYSGVADLHHLQTTVAHALGFTDSTSRLPATDLNTGIITVSHFKYYT